MFTCGNSHQLGTEGTTLSNTRVLHQSSGQPVENCWFHSPTPSTDMLAQVVTLLNQAFGKASMFNCGTSVTQSGTIPSPI
jgi:hypothetical protein